MSPVDVITTEQGAILIPQYRNVLPIKRVPLRVQYLCASIKKHEGRICLKRGHQLGGLIPRLRLHRHDDRRESSPTQEN